MTRPSLVPGQWLTLGAVMLRPWTRMKRRRQLQSAVNQLPERQRALFLLHRIDGLTCSDLAARFALSPQTVEAELAAALVELASALEG